MAVPSPEVRRHAESAGRAAPSLAGPPLSDEEFVLIRDLLYRKAGIQMKETKKLLVQNRLRPRLKALALPTFGDYHRRVLDDENELQEFLDALTTNETFFFREEKHWDFLKDIIIPTLAKRASGAAPAPRSFSLWSAASSTGEELYTAAIVLLEHLPDPASWNLRLVGSDINREVIERARTAVYKPYAVRSMEPRLLKKYFDRSVDGRGGETFRLKDAVRRLCRFQAHNLKDPAPLGNFDLVICRNVFIYFDAPAKEQITAHLVASCARGGHLFFSHTESMVPRLPGMVAIRPSIFQVTRP